MIDFSLLGIDSPLDWFLVILSAMLVSVSKSGLKGIGMLAIPFFAYVFGAKLSTGVLLPILIFADIFAIIYYNRAAEWKYIRKLAPSTILGVFIALVIGENISDQQFKIIIAVVIMISLAIMFWRDLKGKSMEIPDNRFFSNAMGLFGGFATMIGNAAGPILTIYFLSMRLPKNAFIGTAAWFFLLLNLVKLPLHFFIWKTISLTSFTMNTLMIPTIFLGAFIGFRIVKLIPERAYRIFIYIVTCIAAAAMVF